ncbi:MAG: cytochrome C, partial [Planctomycetes bacterium]|nr:cytochrome C [Planctomycetota bacterium]
KHSASPASPPVSLIDSAPGPGWAYNGSFKDIRPQEIGPLPKQWLKYKGQYRHGDDVVLKYTIANANVLEHPSLETHKGISAFTRTLNIDKASENMTMRVLKDAPEAGFIGDKKDITVAILGEGITLRRSGNDILADFKGNNIAAKIIMTYNATSLSSAIASWPAPKDITPLTLGGPLQWPESIKVKSLIGKSKGAYVTEEIPLPEDNPWQSNIRFSGFDFFADGKSAAICTWNGDVWIVSGIDRGLQNLSWKRYAAGLFETLGLRIVDDIIYVTGKDQITRLHDLNNDGEADFYENFNNDIMITRNFHEFTFDLQTDREGNFYFAKGSPVLSGGRGFDKTHAHHGIVFKVSKDGSHSEVWANGLRAPGGMGVGPKGEVTTGENEGTWVPACKINWAAKGTFSGVIHPGNGRHMEQGYDKPLCWMPMTVDNSGGGQVWVDNNSWGPYNGDMLHLSYGRSKIYKVMKQDVDGVVQGGVFELPLKLSSAAMRGRFNPVDKQLYVAGFRGWQTNAAKASALQRIRYTGKAVALPKDMRVTKKGIYISFTQKLDKELAEDISSYSIKWWNYLWSPQYGSAHYSVNNVDEEALQAGLNSETKANGTKGDKVTAAAFKGDDVPVQSVTLQADGKTVFLEIPSIRTVMQMEISLDLETEDGDLIITKIYNSIHKLAEK